MAFAQPSAPGGGDNFVPAEHNGHLLIVYPKSYTDEAKTKHGESSAANVDIVIVDKFDAAGKPLAFIDARVFGNLARSVRNDIGGQVLGRLGQGPNTQGSPPWILANFTDQDVAMASPIDAAYQQGHFKPTPNPMAAQTQPAGNYQPAPGPSPATAQYSAPPAQWQPGGPAAPQAAPQTPAASQPAWSPQQQPAAPQQQWSPAPQAGPPAQTAPPQPAAPAPAAAVDPNLVAFLGARGVQVQPHMTQAECEAIAAGFPA